MTDRHDEFLLLLAQLYLQHEKWDAALVLLKALRVLQPDSLEVAASLALAALQLGNFEASLREADRLLARESRGGRAVAMRLIRSRALWGLGREQEARQALPLKEISKATTQV